MKTVTVWCQCHVKMNHHILFISKAFTQELKLSSYPFQLTRCCLIPSLLSIRTILSFWNKGLGWYNDTDKIVTVKLAFNRMILQAWELLNRLWHALNNLENPKHVSSRGLFVPLGQLYISFCYPYKIPHFKLIRFLRNFSPETIHLLPHRINIWGTYFTWSYTYCGMNRVVTCYRFTYDV